MTEQTPRWLPFSPWVLEWLRHISKLFLELSSQLDLKLQLAFLSLDKRSRTLEPARGHLAEDSLFFCLRALDLECPGRYHGLLLGLHSRFPWIVLDSLPGIDVWFFLQGEQGSSVGDPGRRNLSRKLQTASWLGFLGGSFWGCLQGFWMSPEIEIYFWIRKLPISGFWIDPEMEIYFWIRKVLVLGSNRDFNLALLDLRSF